MLVVIQNRIVLEDVAIVVDKGVFMTLFDRK